MKDENNTIALGVDIGGSHITTALVNLATASVIEKTCVRRPVNSYGYTEEIIDAWAEAIEESWQNHRISGGKIGIAMPGPFDYENGICLISGLNKYEALFKQNIKQLLAERLNISVHDIKLMNDASAFLLGEIMGGAGRGCSRVVGITIGTGVGSALYYDNALHEGDLWCTAFKEARAEDYLSTRWFIQQYGMQSGKIVRGVKELLQLADHDARIKNIFSTFGRHLAEILVHKYAGYTPDVVVIGGNVAKSWDAFMPAALQYLSGQSIAMDLRPAQLEERAAVIGAASLWKTGDMVKGI